MQSFLFCYFSFLFYEDDLSERVTQICNRTPLPFLDPNRSSVDCDLQLWKNLCNVLHKLSPKLSFIFRYIILTLICALFFVILFNNEGKDVKNKFPLPEYGYEC